MNEEECVIPILTLNLKDKVYAIIVIHTYLLKEQ